MMLKMEGGEFLIRREWWMCGFYINFIDDWVGGLPGRAAFYRQQRPQAQ
jgi:hypothetical protein